MIKVLTRGVSQVVDVLERPVEGEHLLDGVLTLLVTWFHSLLLRSHLECPALLSPECLLVHF